MTGKTPEAQPQEKPDTIPKTQSQGEGNDKRPQAENNE